MIIRNQFIINSTFSPVTDSGTNTHVFLSPDLYNMGGGGKSEVPLSILTDGLEPFSYYGSVLKIGGNGTCPTNKAFMVSKQAFKFNPTKYYRVRCRVKVTGAGNTSFSAGFIGLTSSPVLDLISLDADTEWNSILNFSRFAVSTGSSCVSANTDISGLTHFNCIRGTVVPNAQWVEFEGCIHGMTPDDVTIGYDNPAFGASPANPLPMLDKVLFFAPYFIANEQSVAADGMTTLVDYFTVEEIHDAYTI